MSPDSVESRMGRVEQGMARLEQRVDDLATDVRVVMHMPIELAEMRIRMQHMDDGIKSCRDAVGALRKEIAERDEARDNRRWALWVPVGCVVLATIGTLVIQLVTG